MADARLFLASVSARCEVVPSDVDLIVVFELSSNVNRLLIGVEQVGDRRLGVFMGAHVEVLGQDASTMASSWLLIGHDVLHLVVIVHLLHEEVLANHLFVVF